MKRLLIMAVMAGLAAGCAAERVMYAGQITMKSDAPPGLMLAGKNKHPVECYAARGDSLSDLKTGQWVLVEGDRFKDEADFAFHVRECRVTAVAVGDPADAPGLELRRRNPTPVVVRAPSEPAKK